MHFINAHSFAYKISGDCKTAVFTIWIPAGFWLVGTKFYCTTEAKQNE